MQSRRAPVGRYRLRGPWLRPLPAADAATHRPKEIQRRMRPAEGEGPELGLFEKRCEQSDPRDRAHSQRAGDDPSQRGQCASEALTGMAPPLERAHGTCAAPAVPCHADGHLRPPLHSGCPDGSRMVNVASPFLICRASRTGSSSIVTREPRISTASPFSMVIFCSAR